MTDTAWIQWLFERRGREVDPVWWRDAKRPVFGKLLASDVRPFAGVPELIGRLHGEFRLAVASSSWRESIEIVVSAMGLAHCFGALVGKQDVERHKPDPQVFLLAAERLGVEPSACTVIEDSDLGVQAAKAAAMRCIAVTNSLPADRLADADLTLASLEDPDPIIRFARR
jgi:beta-phosphoglucomutase